MLDLVLIALFQAAAGDPAAAPAPAEAPAATEPAPQPAAQTPDTADATRMHCYREIITGTRLTRRVCRSEADLRLQDEETRRTMHQIQRPQPLNGN